MELKVDGISKAKNLIAEGWPTHIISIVNEAGGDFFATVIDKAHDDHHIFSFHDVEDEAATDFVVPTKQDLENILAVARALPEDTKLLVHCTAGKSRSTAVGIGVLVQNGMEPKAALDWMAEHRDNVMFPNRLMIEYIDEILELDGVLMQVVKDYYQEKLHLFPRLVEINRGGYNR